MILEPGFIVRGGYTIGDTIAETETHITYEAISDARGPGRVAVTVSRYPEPLEVDAVQAARADLEQQWTVLTKLRDHGVSNVPVPIDLVRMYPGDRTVRNALAGHRKLVTNEPYLVSGLVAGRPLSEVLASRDLFEERAVRIGIRILRLAHRLGQLGLRMLSFEPSHFMVDTISDAVTIIDLADVRVAAETVDQVPSGFGRLLIGLLTATPAPQWQTGNEFDARWVGLLLDRDVPKPYRDVILALLGGESNFDATWTATTLRLAALTDARKLSRASELKKASDLDYPIPEGTQIDGRFVVGAPLAQGGRGFVYNAISLQSGLKLALKCNKYVYDSGTEFQLELPTRRAELRHEFDMLRAVAPHTHMAPQPLALALDAAYDPWFGLAGRSTRGEPYLLVELLQAVPLLSLLRRPLAGVDGAKDPDNRLDPRFVVRVAVELCAFLEVLHGRNLLFQDLKPENILYDADNDTLHVIDFASVCPRLDDGTLDKSSLAFGAQTHGFAPPEFADLWERVDHRFDIYSLGATIYHLATGVNPERVALEADDEYPQLPFPPLRTLPEPLRRWIVSCLSSLDSRFPDAATAGQAATAMRIGFSRSHPMDVRDIAASYDAGKPQLTWKLPPDPRLFAIRIRAADGTSIAKGPLSESWSPNGVPSETTEYIVETGLTRRERTIWSRGVRCRIPAHPPAFGLEATPEFGGIRLSWRTAEHATNTLLRMSLERPPLDPTDGEPVDDLGPGEVFQIDHTRPVHIAVFARYGEVCSIPIFARVAALPALPEEIRVHVVQTTDAIVVRATPVFAHHRLTVEHSGTQCEFDAEDDGAFRIPLPLGVIYTLDLRAVAPGVDDASRYRSEGTRWAEPPDIDIVSGVGRAEVVLPDVEYACELSLRSGDRELDRWHWVPGKSLEVRGYAGPATLVCVVDPETNDGPHIPISISSIPATSVPRLSPATAPPAQTQNGAASIERPVRLRCDVEPFLLNDARIRVYDIALSAPRLVHECEYFGETRIDVCDPLAEPGTTRTYVAVCIAPNGDRLESIPLTVYVQERLSVVPLEAGVGTITIGAMDIPELEVEVTVGAAAPVIHLVRRDERTLAVPQGAVAAIRVRRHIDGEAMLWNEAQSVRSLRRPEPVADAEVNVAPHGVRVSWTCQDAETERVLYVVKDADSERLVYRGYDHATVDVTPGATNYQIQSELDGITSDVVSVEAAGARVPETRAMIVVSGSSDGQENSLRATRTKRAIYVELSGLAGRWVGIGTGTSAESLSNAAAAVRSIAGLASFAASAVVVWCGADRLVALLPPSSDPCLIAVALTSAGDRVYRVVEISSVPVVAIGCGEWDGLRVRQIDGQRCDQVELMATGMLEDDTPMQARSLVELKPFGEVRVQFDPTPHRLLSMRCGGEQPPLVVPLGTFERPAQTRRAARTLTALGVVSWLLVVPAGRGNAPIAAETRSADAHTHTWLLDGVPATVRVQLVPTHGSWRWTLQVSCTHTQRYERIKLRLDLRMPSSSYRSLSAKIATLVRPAAPQKLMLPAESAVT